MDRKIYQKSDDSLTPHETVVRSGSTIVRETDPESSSGQALRESEERLGLALEAGRMGSWEWRMSTNQVIWSPGLEAMHGIPIGSFPGTFDAYRDDLHPEDRDRVLSCISKTLQDGIDHEIGYRIVLPDGRIRWVEGRGRLFRDKDGNPERMIGVCVDTTDRKEAEEALRMYTADLSETLRPESEFAQVITDQAERLRTILSSIGDGVITTDNEGLVINLNPVAEKLCGWTVEEARGKPLGDVFKIVNETTREPVVNPVMRALNEGVVVGLANHTVLIARDGTERPIDDSAAPIRNKNGEIEGCVLVFHDISERRKTEKAIEKSEHDLRDLFDNATIGIHWLEPDGTIIFANQYELNMLGYTKGEFVGRNIAEFHADENVAASILQALSNGESLSEYPAGMICKDNSVKKVVINSNAFHEKGRFVHSRCFTRDVTGLEAGQAAEKHLAAIVAASDDAIISKMLDGTITSWNQGAERLFGHTAEEAIGEHISLLIPPDRLQEEIEIIERLKKGERVDHFDTIRVRRDGSPVEVSLTISPIPDNTGRIIGASKVARDISERKGAERALRESEERLRLALEAGRMGSWEWRISTNKVIWSPGLEAIHGIPIGSFPGTFDAYQDDMHPEDRDRVLACISHTLNAGVDHEVEYRLVLPDGRIRWVEGRGRLFRDKDGNPERMVGVCVDTTDRKEAEEALRNYAAEMSETDRRKNEFLAMLAHELRNPLAPIRNAVEIMKISAGGSPRLESAANMMERQVGQLVRLVDDLLDVSRISRGKIELRRERIELDSVIYQALEVARPSCKTGGIELHVDQPGSPIYVDGDSARLNQVVGNLLNNACKFTNEGGRIDLTVTEEEGFAVICVKDTGIGIDAEHLPFIFDLFVQADTSLERTVSGLGIGLTLVNNLIEMHGGTVTAHSDGLGRGCEFVVRIPVLKSNMETPEPVGRSEAKSATAGKLRILVVDDNVDSAESLSVLLQFSGHHAETAHDGRQAVDMASSFEPEVILLDIGLPKLNGYEAARAIRTLPKGETIRLIALTGWGHQEDRDRSKEAGFDGHMVKPVDHEALMKELDEIWEAKNGSGH